MPKKRIPAQTNNYMVTWMQDGAMQYIEFIGREAAFSFYKVIRKKYKETCRMYRMVIDGHEEI